MDATIVTGSHAVKVGVDVGSGETPRPSWFTGDVTMTFNSGVPQAVTLRIPRQYTAGYFPELGIYAQDKWTFKRATITGGLRYDSFVGNVGAGTLPSSRWNPSQFFPGFELQHWKDISPRLGVAFDLFGNGKTAVKISGARYIDPLATETQLANNPQTTIGATDTRTWRDLNGDYTIYNGDGSVQWEELGSTSNVNFGKLIPSTNTRDPRTLNGWNSRGATVEWQGVAQHQLTSRLSLSGGYYFRYLRNQTTVDNTLVGPGDYSGPFCVTAPVHADLPGGGGYPVCGLYDITSTARGLVQNNTTFARNFGKGVVDHYQGFDFSATARVGAGTFVNGGVNLQNRVFDNCDTAIDSPEARFCRNTTPFLADFKVSASRTLPAGYVVSGSYQFSPGPQITATWNAPNSVIAPALGRNLAAGPTATKSIQLIEPATLYGESLNQLDVRLSKRFTLGRYRVRADANLYNVFNNDFVNSVNTNFSTTGSNQFMRPTNVLQGRLFKLGGQIEF
jgi:hypothetical protein